MRYKLMMALLAIASAEVTTQSGALAQNPPTPPTGGAAARGGGGGGGGQRGGGGGRGRGAMVMSLSTTAWTDGGQIPVKYSQIGDVSPPLTWSDPPMNTASFVLMAYDMDGAATGSTDGLLHWLVWNIPGTARGLPEGVPQGPQLPDGTRQISQTGPNYRGPAAVSNGPAHHYAFELFALDTVLTIEPVGQPVAATRAAVLAAMQGRVRGKAILIGLFKRPE